MSESPAENPMSPEQPKSFEEAQVGKAVAQAQAERKYPWLSPGAEAVARAGEIKGPEDLPPTLKVGQEARNLYTLGEEPAPENGLNNLDVLNEEERRRREMEAARGAKMSEIIRKDIEPREIRLATRKLLAAEERAIFLLERKPREYTYDQYLIPQVEDRLNEIEMAWDGDGDIVKGYEETTSHVTTPGIRQRREFRPITLTHEELTRLYDELSQRRNELVFRTTILEAFSIQEYLSGSVNDVLNILTQKGKKVPHSNGFTFLGRLPETKEGLPPFGQMIDRGLRLWVDVAENRRAGERDKVTGEFIPPEQRIQNPFREYHWEDNLQKSLSFIVEQLTGERIPQDAYIDGRPERGIKPSFRLEAGLKYRDASDAVIHAYGLFKHFNLHLTYSVFMEDGKVSLSVSQLDATKARYVGLRQWSEMNRDHPYAAGLPAVVGVYPNLARDFFDAVSIEGRGVDRNGNIVEDNGSVKVFRINLKELWRDFGIPLGELPLDVEDWEEGGRWFSQKFREEMDRRGIVEWKCKGAHKMVMGVPWWLVYNYAGAIFSLIFSTDPKEIVGKSQEPTELMNMNKAFGLLFSINYETSGLNSADIEKLRQFTKVTWLAGAILAQSEKDTHGKNKTRIQRRERPLISLANLKKEHQIKEGVLLTASDSGFFSPEGEGLDREKKLFEKILEARRSFLPHNLIGSFFLEDDVRRIYNSGAYDYNPKLVEIVKDIHNPDHGLVVRLVEPRYSQLMEKLS